MLQSPIRSSNFSLRDRRQQPTGTRGNFPEEEIDYDDQPLQFASQQPQPLTQSASQPTQNSPAYRPEMADLYDDDDSTGGDGKGRSKSRRELPSGAVATLKAWLLSPEHFTHPYPTPQDQAMLMQKTGIDKKQLKNWFTNARRRIWKPMLKKQIEQGKLGQTAPGVQGGVPGLFPAMPGAPGVNGTLDNPHSVQAMRVHYQQAMQDQPSAQQQAAQQPQAVNIVAASLDAYGNPVYGAPSTVDPSQTSGASQYYTASDPVDTMQQQEQQHSSHQQQELISSNSIGTLTQISSNTQLSKTDSHAVLMELFARDQDLVRQATESARLKAESKQQGQQMQSNSQQQSGGQQQSQTYSSNSTCSQHPMKAPSTVSNNLANVPSLNSWPHFSSITSLNNLGTIPGVKSIASLSGADLVSKGNVNKMGNLAQVKSMESMGKNDSYAFLEVFFGDRSSNNLSGMGGGSCGNQKGMKHPGDNEDNEIGLSLEDESPSHPIKSSCNPPHQSHASGPAPAPSSMGQQQENSEGSNTLKRAYDDAMAARGLISVSRSSEKLTDLVLPDKIQRTLSQEFISKQQQSQSQQQYSQYSYTPAPESQSSSQQQYPGQQPIEPSGSSSGEGTMSTSSDGHVQVSSATTCMICNQTSVDTQVRPCGHMFHERCLKPSFKNPMGPPKCPIDDIPMRSAVLAVPDNTVNPGACQKLQHHRNYDTTTSSRTLTTTKAEGA